MYVFCTPLIRQETELRIQQVPQQSNLDACGVHAIVTMFCLICLGSATTAPAVQILTAVRDMPGAVRLGFLYPLLAR